MTEMKLGNRIQRRRKQYGNHGGTRENFRGTRRISMPLRELRVSVVFKRSL